MPTAKPVTCCWRWPQWNAMPAPPGQVPSALLRDLVIITTGLVGRIWLDANADSAAAFTALQTTRQPPPLPELDQILARLLSDRFGPAPPAAAAYTHPSPLPWNPRRQQDLCPVFAGPLALVGLLPPGKPDRRRQPWVRVT